jgi:thioredoxin reductase (NADPH)
MSKRVIIIGGGVSGLTAAIYLSRANFEVKVFTGYYNGALSDSPIVENFPGFPDGISGFELLDNMRNQAEKFGSEIIDEKVEKIDFENNAVLSDSDETYVYDYLIIGTGTTPRKLTAKNASKYDCRGIHYCATCDGVVYKDKDVCVVGGGNTALTEALYLSDICRTVTLFVRRNEYRADKVLVEKINQRKNIVQMMNSQIIECIGNDKLERVIVEKEYKTYPCNVDGIFVAIGSDKNDELLKNCLGDDYINKLPANVKLCGDLIESKHQAVIASASGAKVAMEIIENK